MTIEDIIAAAKKHIKEGHAKPIIISVAGGSSTGKSSQIIPQLIEALGDDAALIEQDWYQLGKHFPQKDDTPYKWDDPRNFQIPRLAADLKALKNGQTIVAPSFDVVAVESVGERLVSPRPVIVVDGLYALYGGLNGAADYGVYAETPLYARFLRRLFRLLYEQKQDKPHVAFKQTFGSVLLAHHDFVSKQADEANCIRDIPYLFSDTIERYGLEPKGLAASEGGELLFAHSGLEFIGKNCGGTYHFFIKYGGEVYYEFEIAQEYRQLLDSLDYFEK